MTKHRTKHSKGLIIAVSIFAVMVLAVVIIFAYFVSSVKKGDEILATISFVDVDFKTIADGSYTGEFEAGLVYAKAQATIKEGTLTEIILLEHRNGQGEPAERIVDQMILNQTTTVDVISGATYSSKVIRKAIENALLGE